ncbi:Uncharacterised protein [Mycobacterium tuberculosis]|uniref:Uncharacterized protein n=1 Tax=Mycobacterium tuberculosis TaxID=1773 RepID=A0A655AK37_MYCTX|nr:Uncharacterised protein [Mycobacterium tuberculosis]CKR18747.1 Uncharacterised protein [Mycobacterium tuberculosis]CKT28194.1 Uncharacterised protein [Mycobacterium tuberculosis]CNU50263.1 Uncharacterised protein [Mycobacterium tuberculosis]
MIAPDRHLLDVGDRRAGLGGQLRDRPIVVQPGERREPLAGNVGRIGHRDQRVGVGGVAGHPDANVIRGDSVEGFALSGEDRAVGLQQVTSLHARAPGAGSDQQGQAHTIEDLLGIGTDLHPGQQRESAVVEFHHHTLERLQCRLDLEQPQLDRTVRAQQRAAGQAEQQAVADLAGGAGNGDLERTSAHVGSAPYGLGFGLKLAHRHRTDIWGPTPTATTDVYQVPYRDA